MDPVTVASGALLLFTAGAMVLMVRQGIARGLRRRDELEGYARALAARRHARLLEWRRGWAIVGDKGRMAFTPDVYTAANLRAGVVDVWRIEIAPWAAGVKLEFRLRGRPPIRGQAPVGDLEGRLHLEDIESQAPAVARQVLSAPPVLRALEALFETRPVRTLELQDGVLAAQLERDKATVGELEQCRAAVERLASAIDQVIAGKQLGGRAGAHGLGPSSGEPVPVIAFD